MTRELVALLGGREMGRLHFDRRGRLSFVYAEAWRQDPDARPRLSMPLAAAEHRHAGPRGVSLGAPARQRGHSR